MNGNSGVKPGDPMLLRGSAYARGRAQAANANCDIEIVRASTVGKVEHARIEGLLDAQAEAYLSQQWSFHDATDGNVLNELQGIADGFGFRAADLFAHLHLSLLERLKAGGRTDGDGCSTWAVSTGGAGPLLVKNRDTSGVDSGTQRVFLHEGGDIEAGAMLCVGSLGSPGAYSSGMNAWGLAVADTHVSPISANVGWHRYFLMTRLLASSPTVDAALDVVTSTVHAGGGTITLADASGAVAAIDFSAPRVLITRASACWRTNHYPGTRHQPAEDAVDASSSARFSFLHEKLAGVDWNVANAKALMATHLPAKDGCGSLCQHRDLNGSVTLSAAIYECRSRRLHFSHGNPCESRWSIYQFAPR